MYRSDHLQKITAALTAESLVALRDTLLPKLLSGEVRILSSKSTIKQVALQK